MNPDGTAITKLQAPTWAWSPKFFSDGRTVLFNTSGNACWLRIGVPGLGCQMTYPGSWFLWYPSPSPDGTKIAFDASRTVDSSGYAGPDLYVMNTDGSGSHMIVDGHNAAEPSWSPDGTRIAFTATPGKDSTGAVDIYTAAPDGSDLQQLTHTPDVVERVPDWAPDGSRVVYMAPDNELRTIAADGTDDRHLGTGAFPVYSPEGTQVAAIDGGHVVLIPADGGAPVPVTSGARFSDQMVTWGRAADPLPTPTPTPTPTATPAGTPQTTTYGYAIHARPWRRAPHVKVTRSTRRVPIVITAKACGGLDHVTVRRRAHDVVIKAFVKEIVTDGYHIPACPVPVAVRRTVSLHGRLGHRVIRDGATGAVRYRPR
jgi:dipeptidyl aminopeptidase/acylaminoacyl peptidase